MAEMKASEPLRIPAGGSWVVPIVKLGFSKAL